MMPPVDAQHVHRSNRVIDTGARIPVFAPLHAMLLRGPTNADTIGRLISSTQLATCPRFLNNTGTLHTTARRTRPRTSFCRSPGKPAVAAIQQGTILEPQPKLVTSTSIRISRTLSSLHTPFVTTALLLST